MSEQTWHHHGRLKQFWLQQCTKLESAVLTCIGLLRFQLHFTCGATLFLSFEVRTCCDSAVDFTGKKVVSVVAIFKKSKSPVIFTCLSKESALPGVFVDFSVARGELPPPRYGCWRLLAHELHRSTESNFRFVPVAQTQYPSTSGRPSLKSPCRLQSCPAQEFSST